MLAWRWTPDALTCKKAGRKRETYASPLRGAHALGSHGPDQGIANDMPKTNTSSSWHLNHHRDALTASHISLKPLLNFKFNIPIVRRQGFWNQRRPNLRESLAHLVDLIMRLAGGDASVAFRASFV